MKNVPSHQPPFQLFQSNFMRILVWMPTRSLKNLLIKWVEICNSMTQNLRGNMVLYQLFRAFILGHQGDRDLKGSWNSNRPVTNIGQDQDRVHLGDGGDGQKVG